MLSVFFIGGHMIDANDTMNRLNIIIDALMNLVGEVESLCMAGDYNATCKRVYSVNFVDIDDIVLPLSGDIGCIKKAKKSIAILLQLFTSIKDCKNCESILKEIELSFHKLEGLSDA
jgi:hypothetical protein